MSQGTATGPGSPWSTPVEEARSQDGSPDGPRRASPSDLARPPAAARVSAVSPQPRHHLTQSRGTCADPERRHEGVNERANGVAVRPRPVGRAVRGLGKLHFQLLSPCWSADFAPGEPVPRALCPWSLLRGGEALAGGPVHRHRATSSRHRLAGAGGRSSRCRFQLHSLKQAFVLPLLFPHPVAAWQPRKLLTATGLPCVPWFGTKRMTSPRH